AVLQQKIDVLTAEILQALVRRQLQLDDRHIADRFVDRFDPARQTLDADVARTAHLLHFDHEIGQGHCTAKERESLAFLVIGERGRLVATVVDFTVEYPALAASARAVAAAVGQHEIGGDRGLQHRIAVGAGERMLAWLYGNLRRHYMRFDIVSDETTYAAMV